MKRPACTLAILATLLLPALEGCAKHPLTDSEFRGFCYTIVDRWASCDTIDICNDFDANALSKKEPSQQACLADCDMELLADRLELAGLELREAKIRLVQYLLLALLGLALLLGGLALIVLAVML